MNRLFSPRGLKVDEQNQVAAAGNKLTVMMKRRGKIKISQDFAVI